MASTQVGGNQLRLSTVHKISGNLAGATVAASALENVTGQGLVLTGSVFLLAAPSEALEAATKQYVDDNTGSSTVDKNQVVFGNPAGTGGFESYTGLWVAGTAANPELHVSGAMSIGKVGDLATTLTVDASAGISLDAATASNVKSSGGVLTLESGKTGASALLLSASHAAGGVTIEAGTGDLVLNSDDLVDINATGVLSMDGSAINIGIAADVAVDFDASTFDLDASAALTMTSTTMALDPSSTFDLDAGGAITIDGTSFTVGGDSDTGAIAMDSTAGISLDAAAASNFSVSAGGLTLLSTGDAASFTVASDEAAEDLTIQQTGANDSSIIITAAGTGTDAVSIDATAGSMVIAPTLINGKTLTIGPSSATQMVFTPHGTAASEKISLTNTAGTAVDAIAIDATAGGVSIDGAAASNFTTSSGALTLDGAGGVSIAGNAAEVDITTTGAVDINSAAGTWDSSAGISLDAAAASNFSTSAGALTLASATGSFALTGKSVSSNITLTSDADAQDLTIALAGAYDSSLILSSTGTSASDAIKLSTSAGGISLQSAGAVLVGGVTSAQLSGATTVIGATTSLTMPSNFERVEFDTGDGSAVAFALLKAPAGNDALAVYLNGILQADTATLGSSADYALSGVNVTFVTAPVADDVIQYRYRSADIS